MMISKLFKILSTIFCLLNFVTFIYAFTPPTSPYSDPPDSYTKLQCSFDEADGSTTTDDESAGNYTMTAAGNAQTDTAQYKWTASSLHDGVTDSWTVPDSTDWDFGTADFTVDFWIRKNNLTTSYLFDVGSYGDNYGITLQNWSGGEKLYIYINGSGTSYARDWAGPVNTWFHLAITRSGTTMKLFSDGGQLGVDITDSSDIQASTFGVTIGAKSGGGNAVDGWIDEFRISKGIARDWAAARKIINIAYKVDIGSLNQIGTPLWSCKIKLLKWWKNKKG